MAILNMSLDKIENTGNKVTGLPNAAWTDTQYPSAKSVYEAYQATKTSFSAMYPVGSVVCMSTNTNPASSLGGSWSLIDKEFRHTWITAESGAWTATNATFNSCSLALYGHEILIRLVVTPKSDPGDNTVTLGKLNFAHSSIGLPSTLYFANTMKVAQCDGANATMCYTFNDDGTLYSYDCLNVDGTHSLTSPTSYAFYFTDYFTCAPVNMPDKYCNKFYFQRTA
jgi:hypothetical protein